MRNTVKTWLESGEVDLFLGYRLVDGHPLPHAFSRDCLDELETFVTGPARYPLEKMAAEILAKNPDLRVGVLVRECNERALTVLSVTRQLDLERTRTLKASCCPSTLHHHAACSYLKPEESGALKRERGIDNSLSIEAVEAMSGEERFSRWMYEFEKCLKCYGCRDICPVCLCPECTLQNPELIETGALPVEAPIFHLVRAVHMAGRCVDCGLCEEACPMDIPLRLLYRKVSAVVKQFFDYEPGTSVDPLPLGPLTEEEIRKLGSKEAA